MIESYPEALILLVLIAGGLLAITKPFSAFLFACFGLSAVNMTTAFSTRTFLGPYFNLVDAFLVVMLFALALQMLDQRPAKLIFPRPLAWLLVTWVIGTLLGVMTVGGARYEMIREARWALNFPIGILVAANFVTDERRSTWFVWVLFAGAVMAAIQHIFVTRNTFGELSSISSTSSVLSGIRNIGFMFSPISCFFIAAIQPSVLGKSVPRFARVIWWFGVALFLTSILLDQTRSQWIAVVLSIVPVTLLVGSPRYLFKVVGVLVIVLVLASVVFPLLIPGLDPLDLVLLRYNSLSDEALRYQTTLTRQNAIRVEGSAWLEGGPIVWLLGRGLGYRWADEWAIQYGATSGEGEMVAWGHVGYISYLANLGLLGFIVYGIYLPLYGILSSRQIYQRFSNPSIRLLAILVLASVMVNPATFVMSGSYLQPEMVVPGLLLGAAVGILPNYRLVLSHEIEKRGTWKLGRVLPL